MASGIMPGAALRPATQSLVTESKILLVGTGGVGCEVLKNLVLLGFGHVEIIDRDTIGVSDLNRQFLFQRESVGVAKAIVARESALKFNENVNITAHVGDIEDGKYGPDFYRKFNLVISAVDNRAARVRVNRMCLSCNIPLIESGTEGYKGQVEIMLPGRTPCYECGTKPVGKTYPTCCVIYNPEKPIHCIEWAKFLFAELFGELEEYVTMQVMNVALNSDRDNLYSVDDYDDADDYTRKFTRDWALDNDYDNEKLFKKIFIYDIHYIKNKMPYRYEGRAIKPVLLDDKFLRLRSDYKEVTDEEIMNLEQNITMFLDSIILIKEKLLNSNYRPLIWDKHDNDFMNFVVSSANIRCKIFNIPMLSRLEITKTFKNYTAIATSNAIIAGQMSIHALRILDGQMERCTNVYLRMKPNHVGGLLVKDVHLEWPHKECIVCSFAYIILLTDLTKLTFLQFQELVLKKRLQFTSPEVRDGKRILISNDEEDKLDIYCKYFSELQIEHGSIFYVNDGFQNNSIKLKIHHKDRVDEKDELFELFANEDDMEKKLKNKLADDNDCMDNNDLSSDKYIQDALSHDGDYMNSIDDDPSENISVVNSIRVEENIVVDENNMVANENLVTEETRKRMAEDEITEETKKKIKL